MNVFCVAILLILTAGNYHPVEGQASGAVCTELNTARQYDVIIIGAGAAGMVAAQRLHAKGITNVTVLEARNRLGGRMHTITEGESFLDMGAQYLHGVEGNPVYKFAEDWDLVENEDDIEYEDEDYYLDDGSAVSEDDIEEAWALLEEQSEDVMDEDDYDETTSIGQQMRTLMNATTVASRGKRLVWEFYYNDYAADVAADLHEAHVDNWVQFVDFDGPDANAPSEGYMAIFTKLISKLPNSTFQLNTKVSTIFWQLNCPSQPQLAGKAAVRLANGQHLVAKYIIQTLPLGVLKAGSVTFSPALATSTNQVAKDKARAIDRMGFGCIGKVFMRWQEAFWKDSADVIGIAIDPFSNQNLGVVLNNSLYKNEDDKNWYRHMNGWNSVYDQDKVLQAWFIGKWAKVVEYLPVAEVRSVMLQIMKRFLRTVYPTIPDPVNVLKSEWCNDELAMGTYSFISMQSAHEDYSVMAKPLPDESQPTLLWAGEATNNKQWGTVPGAWQTGFREAERVARLMNSAGRGR